MQGMKVCIINNGIEIEFGNFLAVVNQTDQRGVQVGIIGNDLPVKSFFGDLAVYKNIFIGITLVTEFPYTSVETGIDGIAGQVRFPALFP